MVVGRAGSALPAPPANPWQNPSVFPKFLDEKLNVNGQRNEAYESMFRYSTVSGM